MFPCQMRFQKISRCILYFKSSFPRIGIGCIETDDGTGEPSGGAGYVDNLLTVVKQGIDTVFYATVKGEMQFLESCRPQPYREIGRSVGIGHRAGRIDIGSEGTHFFPTVYTFPAGKLGVEEAQFIEFPFEP